MLVDANDVWRQTLRLEGISWTLVVDAEGIIRWHSARELTNAEELETLGVLLEGQAKRFPGGEAQRAGFTQWGIRYSTAQAEVRAPVGEWEPSLALFGSDRFALVTLRAGDEGWQIATARSRLKTGRVESTVEICPGSAANPLVRRIGTDAMWVVWGDQRETAGVTAATIGGVSTRIEGDDASAPMRTASAAGDVFPSSLATDARGRLWLATTEWQPWPRASRDREIFVRICTSSGWSAPIQVSPTGVPDYEDHTDPALCPDGEGNMWVAWSWDYHGTLKEEGKIAEEPTIFGRLVSAEGKLGRIMCIGSKGTGEMTRSFAPAVAPLGGGKVAAVWIESCLFENKVIALSIRATRFTTEGAEDAVTLASFPATKPEYPGAPRLFPGEGGPFVVYPVTGSDGVSRLHRHLFTEEAVSDAVTIDDPFLGDWSGAVDEDGSLWVAAVRTPAGASDPMAGKVGLKRHVLK
ncbi:MAG: hypothetical protein HYY93_08125 [Planctomycetes bacterium]|nr:hypothetical protein [Planctomycetota bacterium]